MNALCKEITAAVIGFMLATGAFDKPKVEITTEVVSQKSGGHLTKSGGVYY